MTLQFKADDHSYTTVGNPHAKWTSVTTLIGKFKEYFDKEAIALKVSKKKNSKWYGLEPSAIIAYWDAEAERANTCGTWYHNQREKEVLDCDTICRDGVNLKIISPLMEGDIKIAPPQALSPGIYPEHFVYLESAYVCGQADRVEVVGDRVDVYDYKSNKKLDKESYVNWEGVSKKMHWPLEHLDDCNFNHYTLQLGIYMYIILKHNPHLKPGKIVIQHVTFEWASVDEFGFPTIALDTNGDPIIKDVTTHDLPYLKKEIQAIFNTLK